MAVSDYIIVVIALLGGGFFLFLWANTLYKFYLGVVIGFLLFLFFNAQIDLLENLYSRELSSFQSFLIENKDLVLTLAVLGIPLLGILSAANQSFSFHGRKSVIGLFGFWAFLPLFLLGLLAYIGENIYTSLPFVTDILGYLDASLFLEFIRNNLSWVIIGLLVLIFYKALFLLVFAFIAYMYETMKSEFTENKKEMPEEVEE